MLVTVSREEADILSSVDGHCQIHPILPAEPHIPFTTRPFDERRDIGYVAGWLAGPTSPNAHGLRWFVDAVLPWIRKTCPWVRLRVTGSKVPAEIRELACPNVVFEGEVADLAAFYDGLRVAISPALFGAGVKLKTVQALQYGVPIVATTIGAEGIETCGLPAIDVTDDPEMFANLVVTLVDGSRRLEHASRSDLTTGRPVAIRRIGCVLVRSHEPCMGREAVCQTLVTRITSTSPILRRLTAWPSCSFRQAARCSISAPRTAPSHARSWGAAAACGRSSRMPPPPRRRERSASA